jgi:hypothetical protein
MRVIVQGQETNIDPDPNWHIGIITTTAAWATGYGNVPFDAWEIRDGVGNLLNPFSRPGHLKELYVNRRPGVGGL